MKKAARGRARATRRVRAPGRTSPAVPAGYHTVTPQLTVRGAAPAIEFSRRAFGGRELERMPAPGGTGLMHAELRMGDSIVFPADEFPDMGSRAPQTLGGATGSFHVYAKDVDRAFKRAVGARAQREVQRRAQEFFARMGRL